MVMTPTRWPCGCHMVKWLSFPSEKSPFEAVVLELLVALFAAVLHQLEK